MTILEDFESAAIEIFETFESLIIAGTHIMETSTYVAGGDNVVTRTNYPVRLIRSTSKSTLTLQSVGSVAEDVTFKSEKYLAVTSELTVIPKVKDKILIGTNTKVILSIESDPGDVVQVFFLG